MDLLGQKESLLNTKWPQTGPVDDLVIRSSEYLMEAAREFRLKLKAASLPPKAKKGASPKAPEKPTHATIYVAKTYPPWQEAVLKTLKVRLQTIVAILKIHYDFLFYTICRKIRDKSLWVLFSYMRV